MTHHKHRRDGAQGIRYITSARLACRPAVTLGRPFVHACGRKAARKGYGDQE